MKTYLYTLGFASLVTVPLNAETSTFWLPQKAPAGIVRSTNHETLTAYPLETETDITDGAFGAMHFLLQSISGLAAKAVNEGRLDEMVWIEVGHPEDSLNSAYDVLYHRAVQRLAAEERGSYSPWELLQRYQAKGIVNGYVLYRFDRSEGGYEEIRRDMDQSANLATSMAGILGGVLIEESLEPAAKALGLPLLYDARDKDPAVEFALHLDKFENRTVGVLDPKVPNQRDYLITHGAAVYYGYDETMDSLLANTVSLSPVIGWNGGDEKRHTQLVSEYALFNTASNRVINMPLITAGAHDQVRVRRQVSSPQITEPSRQKPALAYVMSDGDNMSWFLGEILTSRDYLGNPRRGKFPISWTTCLATLIQMAPDSYDAILDTLTVMDGVSEFTGGYFFPEYFGTRREESDLLRAYARKLSPHLQATGQTIFHFMVMKADAPEALTAYQVFAEELDGLRGMTLTEYAPYEGAEGAIYWTNNLRGERIPVVAAAYSVWEGRTSERRGDPIHLSERVNEHFKDVDSSTDLTAKFRWAVIHAWSRFPVPEGQSERGVDAIWQGMERIDTEQIDLITIEELIERIRAEDAWQRAE